MSFISIILGRSVRFFLLLLFLGAVSVCELGLCCQVMVGKYQFL